MQVYEKVRAYIEERGYPQGAVAEKAGIPVRFAATKAIEGDPLILEQLK